MIRKLSNSLFFCASSEYVILRCIRNVERSVMYKVFTYFVKEAKAYKRINFLVLVPHQLVECHLPRVFHWR